MDFVRIYTKTAKNTTKNRKSGSIEVCLDFKVAGIKDLMTRGHSFYAIFDEETKLWSKKEIDIVRLIDNQIMEKVRELENSGEVDIHYQLMNNYESGLWQKYVTYVKSLPDNWHSLDKQIVFNNNEITRSTYATRRLPYSLQQGDITNYETLMNTLYDKEERDKLEWAVGAILSGDSRKLQKFITLYGSPGSGKSTFLNIVQKLVEGYYISFNAKDLVGRDMFGMEVFKNDPLVAIQHDGDLSRIEDNSLLNSIISHEEIVINEKHKSKYTMTLECFLFLGTNKPVSISDSKSGLLRRLIDVQPSGRKLSPVDYIQMVNGVNYELGHIAHHCIEKYRKMGFNYYQNYTPKDMMFETNTLYNFIFDNILFFEKEQYIQLKQVYDMYKSYCDESGENFPLKKRVFRAEMKSYFDESHDVLRLDGKQLRSVYTGFKKDIFQKLDKEDAKVNPEDIWIKLGANESYFDRTFHDRPAQLANEKGTPSSKWDNVHTVLKDIDTRQLHYVNGLDANHIVIDFDLKDIDGNKSLERNLQEANKWPKTYAELSKSGQGIHLHYFWDGGDVEKLERLYSEDIEVKVFTGNSSLRRKLSLCNEEAITTICSGLKYKSKGGKMVNKDIIENERHLRILIKKCLNKENHGATKPEMDFIFKLLNDSYQSGMIYDVSDMKSDILSFAAGSTNQSEYCLSLLSKMKFASDLINEPTNSSDDDDSDIVFYDVEVFKNVFMVVCKMRGKSNFIKLIQPTPNDIAELFKYKLVGFNNKRYDDHILYAAYLGYNNEQIYDLSKKLITKTSSAKNGLREAYSIAYTDVFDFCVKKQSLKKWEVELGLKHEELEHDWDEPLPEEKWQTAIEYCCNDVLATEAVFEHCQGDWLARKILADITNTNPNMTTNNLTAKLVFGNEKNPQLVYTELENTFPGYSFEMGSDNKMHNMYRGTDVSFGGYVYSNPGYYVDVALLDIQSMHPSSIIAMNYFGEYTKNYKELLDTRVLIKQGRLDEARKMMGGRLEKYIDRAEDDENLIGDLSNALKIALNSAYGLTSASYENIMRDSRNKNNIVALRGALFMKTLQDEVEAKGYTVAHIKTDSIKIPNATPEIIEFCKEFAKKYGYIFEHEATYSKMCLVNKAVYIAKYSWAEKKKKIDKWEAVGSEFAEPYVFKKLFSKEPIIFEDYTQTKSVTGQSAMYLDFNEGDEDNHNYIYVGKVGSFVPIMDGFEGGLLLRKNTEGQYHAVQGTKGFRWKESEMVRGQCENEIDILYYNQMLKDAIKHIEQYVSIDILTDSEYIDNQIEELIGFDETPPEIQIADAIVLN